MANHQEMTLVVELSMLVRRYCLSAYGREQAAGLTGAAWLKFLDKKGKTQALYQRGGEGITDGPLWWTGKSTGGGLDRPRRSMAQKNQEGKAMIELGWPWTLVLLPAPWVVRWVLPTGEPPVTESALRVPFFDAMVGLQSSHSLEKPRSSFSFMFWLAMVIWVLLLVAGSRPQWIGEPMALPVSGRDVMLAVDISGSMEIPDFSLNGESVNRLASSERGRGQIY